MTILSPTVFAQLSQDSYQRCYSLTTTRQCFKTARSPVQRLQNFTGAIHWCTEQGYSLVEIESAAVQTAVEQFLDDFELTSDDIWIAARRSTERQWTWVNGNIFTDGRRRLTLFQFTTLLLYLLGLPLQMLIKNCYCEFDVCFSYVLI